MKPSCILAVAALFLFSATFCHAAKTSPAPPAGEAAKSAPAAAQETKIVKPPAGKGMVWVNPESKVYHRQGSKWYGKTKKGSYMAETEAIKEGYREVKGGTR